MVLLRCGVNQVTSSEYPRLTLLRCQVTGKGQPIITFAKSNPDAKGGSSLVSFTFDSGMESWYDRSQVGVM